MKLKARKRLVIILVALGASFCLVLLLVLGAWIVVRRSLPRIDGVLLVRGVSAPVTIERDRQGVPTIHAEGTQDVSYGLGFVHGQDRFFQMDELRRYAAGELSEIFGPGPDRECVEWDRRARVHRFRSVAARVVERLSASQRRQLDAYIAGVRAGLQSLGARPFEYLLLGETPRPWECEDSVLVLIALFIDLQGDNIAKESARGLVRDLLPGPLAEFLTPRGSIEWDAPMFGAPIAPPPIPGPDVFDLRNEPPGLADTTPWDGLEDFVAGSNNWALSGARTTDGRAWLANDMHLQLRVPNIWYRACLDWPGEDGLGRRMAAGVTLPGGPGIVVGSNGRVAWGFTNTQGDWSDLIELDVPPDRPDHYRTPGGLRRFESQTEVIRVKGKQDISLTVESTVWGPVIGADHRGRKRALCWVAGDPDVVDLGLMDLSLARTLEEGLDQANRCGAPHQNLVMVDAGGRIGWTILGRIPRRRGFDGRVPECWADGSRGWDGHLPPSESPRLVDPPSGQLWSANARVCAGEDLMKVGDGGYDRGARAKQIRDHLSALGKASPADMLALQLDDRALFLERWRSLLLGVLTPEAMARDERRWALRTHVEGWGGRASVDSVGYRMVWEFRLRTVQAVLSPLTARCRAADPEFRLRHLHTLEGPAWALVTQRPLHLLDPNYRCWDALLLAVVDAMLMPESADRASLAVRTWGAANTARIRHPLSLAVPWLSRLLDMPADPLPGGRSDMPRIQGPDFGASERLAVSPGAEGRGIFHMPCGQSGHPLSPFYREGHDDWVHGRTACLLPGPPIATLVLSPER
jgi:penicillin amidase